MTFKFPTPALVYLGINLYTGSQLKDAYDAGFNEGQLKEQLVNATVGSPEIELIDDLEDPNAVYYSKGVWLEP